MLSSESIRPGEPAGSGQERRFRRIGRESEAGVAGELGVLHGEWGCLALQDAADGVIRLKLFPEVRSWSELDMSSTEAVMHSGIRLIPDLRRTDDAFNWSFGAYSTVLLREEGRLCFLDRNGSLYASIGLMEWSGDGEACVRVRLEEDSRCYGLGEKTGFLDKRGERYEMWNSDVFSPHVPDTEALYQSIPFLMVSSAEQCFGVFLDNPGRTTFDMRTVREAAVLTTYSGPMDLYLLAGPRPKDVIGRYTALTGRMQLPPRWALGYHQSRYSYDSQEEVLRVARALKEKDIPCDAIHLDIHYMDRFRVFTFDPDRFPDPAGMTEELKELGIRTVAIVDPGIKLDPDYAVCREGLEQGRFCTDPDGEPFIGPVWPGDSLFPDFLNEDTAEWWGDLHRFYTERGIEGIWNDMNEPSVFNEAKTLDSGTVHLHKGKGMSHGDVHNLYGFHMCQSTWKGMEKQLAGRRPFVLTRAGYAGIQRYAAVWTGDNRSYWEHLAMSIPMVLNLGLSGVAFAGADIGGFAHHTSGELLARWTQLGALYPYCRNHSEWNSVRQEPWCFGPRVEEICRRYIQLRYRLMPYLYSLFREAAETGMPVMRPLVLEYPRDPRTFNLCDQFLVGSHMLAAPVLRPATEHRIVYLPEGVWFDYWTDVRYEGPCTILAHAPLDTLPLFVKEGLILPSNGEDPEELVLDVYGSGTSSGDFELYEDDGETLEYRNGSYNLWRMEFTVAGGEARFRFRCLHHGYSGSWRRCVIRFHGLSGEPNLRLQGLEPERWSPILDSGMPAVRLEVWPEDLDIRVNSQ